MYETVQAYFNANAMVKFKITHLHRVRHAVVIIVVVNLGEKVLTQLENKELILSYLRHFRDQSCIFRTFIFFLTINKEEKYVNLKTKFLLLHSHLHKFFTNKQIVWFLSRNT